MRISKLGDMISPAEPAGVELPLTTREVVQNWQNSIVYCIVGVVHKLVGRQDRQIWPFRKRRNV